MGLRIIRYKDGYRPNWHAEYKENGKIKTIKLTEEIKGTPPPSLSIKDEGSTLYEKSKARALAEFEKFMEERKQKGTSEQLLEKLYASKTGTEASYPLLKDLGVLWNNLPREKPLSEGRIANNLHVAQEFASHCKRTYIYEVTEHDVKAFMDWLKGQGFAWTSIKSKLSFLSGAFGKFNRGKVNPFSLVIKRNTDPSAQTIHRVPLTNGQIEALRDEAKGDELLYPLVECGLATGARLVDIAHMKKENIDLREGFITFTAQKTGTVCDIPLFDEFRKICEGIINSSDPDEPYLFPEAAFMYDTNRSGLVDRGKRLFANALFKDIGKTETPTLIIDGKPKEPLAAYEVYTLIDKYGDSPSQRDRLKTIYDLYIVKGKSYRQIEDELKLSRSYISHCLKLIENLTGDKLIRFDEKHNHIVDKLAMTRKHREGAKRAVSIYGWACLRSTFCRLAIERGVDEKMIMRAVGHSNFKTTMTYYDNPTRTHQREQMKMKMAATAIGHSTTPSPTAANLLDLINKLSPEQQALLAENLKALTEANAAPRNGLAISA